LSQYTHQLLTESYTVLRLIVGADERIGEPTTSIETDGVGFFPVDDLPELSVMRVTEG
jgi:hypothetical protein